MQYRFQILSRNSAISNILSDEIYYWLNFSQESLVKNIFGEDNKVLNEFEITQKKKDDLQSIVQETQISISASPHTNKHIFNLVSDYWFKVREQCTITFDDCHGNPISKKVSVIEAEMNNIDRMLIDPYSEHNLRNDYAKPLRLLFNDKVTLISDDNYIVSNYVLYYIQKPTVITRSNSCNLPIQIHEDIVQIAYKLCYNNYLMKNTTPKTFRGEINN